MPNPNNSNSDIDFNSAQLETSLTESQRVSSGLGDLKAAVRNAYSDSTVTSMGYKSPLKTVETMEEDVDGVTKAIRYITSLLTGALDVAHDQFEQAAQSEPTTTTIYDSFHGVQNQPAYDFAKKISGKLKGVVTKPLDKLVKNPTKKASGALNDKFGHSMKNVTYYDKNTPYKLDENGEVVKDKNGNPVYDKDKAYTFGKNYKFGSVNFIDKNKKYSNELWKREAKYEGKYGEEAYAGVRVGTIDANAGFKIGPDHIVAEAGATVTAITGEAKYKSPAWKVDGLEIASASASASASVGYASLKGKIGAGVWKDKDGKFHKELGVQANAEADLVKANAQVSGTLCGVEGTVSAGVKVGVGAQLDAGIVDGTFRFKVSLAVGVGVELGFSLNFNKLGSWVTEKAKPVVEKVGKAAEKAWEGVKSAGKKVGKFFKSIFG